MVTEKKNGVLYRYLGDITLSSLYVSVVSSLCTGIASRFTILSQQGAEGYTVHIYCRNEHIQPKWASR